MTQPRGTKYKRKEDNVVVTYKAAMWFRRLNSNRMKRIGFEFFWICSGQAVAMLGALVGIRILTGVLSPNVYGELALGMTVAVLVNQVVLGPLSGASLRFFALSQENGEFLSFLAALKRLLRKATWAILLIAGITVAGFILAGQFNRIWFVIAAFSFALFTGYNSILDGMQNAARQRGIVAWHNALASWGRFLIAAGLVLWLGSSGVVAMLGYVAASVAVLLSQIWFFKHKLLSICDYTQSQTDSRRKLESQMLSYAWPFAAWGILTWAQSVSDRWALQLFTSTREVGFYAVLYQLGYYPLIILSGLIVQLVAPVFFQRAGDASDNSKMRQVYILNGRMTWVALILTMVMTGVATGFHSFIFRILAAPEYRSVSWLLPAMVLSGGLFGTGQLAVISLLSRKESRILIAPKIVTAIGGVFLNFLAAAWFGIPGVVTANLLFSMAYVAWVLCLTHIENCRLQSVTNVISQLETS